MADDSSEEFESTPLSEYDSYEEYLDEEMLSDPAMQSDEIDSRKVKLIRYGFYAILISILLIIVGFVGFLMYEVGTYLLDYMMKSFG